MVINRLLQLDLCSKVQMTAYADDLAIYGGAIGEDTVYEQMTTVLKKIENKAMQLGLKFSPEKCEALWYRSVDPDINFKIAGVRIPWRASVKYLWVILDKRLNFKKQVDYVRQKTDSNMHLLTVLNSLSDAKYFLNIYNYTINIGVRSSYLRNDGCEKHRQVTGRSESRNASYSLSTTRHKCQDDDTRTSDVTRRT